MSSLNHRKMFYCNTVLLSVAITLILVGSSPAPAQVSTGTILGTVKDASGALIPGANVTAVNVGTTQSRTDVTGHDGSFRLPALQPGHYSVKVEKQGFRSETETNLTLEVTQELTLNITLQVGSTQQQVEVIGAAGVVNTTSPELGGTVDEQKMTDLPLNGRNYIDLALMQAGVTNNPNVVGSHASGGTEGVYYSASGASMRSNSYTIDGATMVNIRGANPGGEGSETLGVDGIQEFRVVTGNFDASYGLVSGSQVVLVSKGGTNVFHGDVFEYLRNSSLDARNYFDTAAGSPGKRLPEFQRNNFGGAFGGPIQKDKTFFFAVYEGLRQNLGQTVYDTVPEAGCFGAAGATITNTECPLLGSTASVTISPATAPLLALFPHPTCTTVNCTAFAFRAPSNATANYGQIRVDHTFSASDSLFGRYTTDADNSNSFGSGTSTGLGTGYPQFFFGASSDDDFLTLSENHIFSSALLNTLRMSYSRTHLIEKNVYPGGAASLTGPQLSIRTGQPVGGISPGSGVTGFAPNGNDPQYGIVNTYSLSDDVYHTKGKHALKFGILMNKYNTGMAQANSLAGSLSFSNYTQFLKGIPFTWGGQGVANPINDKNFMYYTFGFYMQDDWRALQRLTLNLGLRYEAMTVPSDTGGRNNALIHPLTDANPTPGPIMTNPTGAINFQPRIGLAWDVLGNGKLAIHAAGGIYDDIANITSALFVASKGDYPYDAISTNTNNSETPLRDTSITPLAQQITFTALEAHSFYGLEYRQKQPTAVRTSLAVEYQLPKRTVLQVAYVGTYASHQIRDQEDNPQIPVGFVNNYPVWAAGGPRINPNWPSTLAVASDGHSSYNALQATLNRRVGSLAIQSSYTYSHLIDNMITMFGTGDCTSSGMNIPVDEGYVPNYNRGPECYDNTHVLNFNAIYHVQNIRSDNFLAKLEHGWWMSPVVTGISGAPFTPMLSVERSNTIAVSGDSADRANVGTVANTVTIGGSSYAFIPYNRKTVITENPNQWFNPLMFDLGPVGTLGDAGRGMLRGPDYVDFDYSLVKDTHIPLLGEQGMVEFRTEVFNVLNRPNFSQPSGAVFSGAVTDTGTYSEAPLSTAGKITATNGTARQIQFALRFSF